MLPLWQQNVINSSWKKHVYVIEWLTHDENVIGEMTLDVIGGSTNFDSQNNNRRSFTMTVKNLNKKYIPTPYSNMWINNKLRLKAGYEYGDGQRLLFNQGVYVLGNPSLLSSPVQKEATIQGLDKWTLLDGTIQGELKNKLIIKINTRVDTAIQILIQEEAGERKFIIDPCDVLLPHTIEKEQGSNIADVIKEIADIVSYEAFYDNEGYFIFRKALKPEDYGSIAPSWSYAPCGLYLESTRDINWNDVRNSIKVTGATMPGIAIEAVAQDITGSEFSIDKIGERFKSIDDDNIPSVELAQERADWELLQRLMVSESVNVNIIPNFSHVLGDIVQVTDPDNGTDGNYLIQSISYGLEFNTTMKLGLWKLRDWR